MLTEPVKALLRQLADKYETPSFSDGDPSFVLKRYPYAADTECAALIAAVLSFGRREQFLKKIEYILSLADKSGGPALWIHSGDFETTFLSGYSSYSKTCRPPDANDKFYRFYSFSDFLQFFRCLQKIYLQDKRFCGSQASSAGTESSASSAITGSQASSVCDGSRAEPADKTGEAGKADTACSPADDACSRDICVLGDYFSKKEKNGFYAEMIAEEFSGCRVIPHGKNCANKRINMFLRWMVRRNSPVDTGLWNWIDPSELIVPLDVHVFNQAAELGILPASEKKASKTGGTIKDALLITESLKEIWPDDPCKGDFALFGYDIDKKNKN